MAAIQNSNKDEIVELFMASYIPEDITLAHGAITYHSTVKTHESFYSQWVNALPNTWARKVYTDRCYDWLLLLKKRGVQMKKNDN